MLVHNIGVRLTVALALLCCAVLASAPCASAYELYASMAYLAQIHRWNAFGHALPAPGQTGDMFATLGSAWNADGIAIGSDGYVYFARNNAGDIVRYSRATGQKDTSWSIQLVPQGSSDGPGDLQFSGDGFLYCASRDSTANIWKIDVAGKTFSVILSGLVEPYSIDFDTQGRLYTVNYWGARVLRYVQSGEVWTQDTSFAGVMPNNSRSYGVAVAPNGMVYATDYLGGVCRFDSSGNRDATWSVSALSPGTSTGIDIGPDENVYVSSEWYIYKIDPTTAAASILVNKDPQTDGNRTFIEWSPTEAPPPAGSKKKLFEFGWDSTFGATFVRNNVAEMEQAPFDGCVVQITNPAPSQFSWEAWGTRLFTQGELQSDIDALKATKFRKFTDNFIRLVTTPGDVDWFDDAGFNVIVSNCALAARMAKLGGMKGILFDNEYYQNRLWDYHSQKYWGSKSYAQYAAQVRLRGQQVMDAFESEYPGITVICIYGYTGPWVDVYPWPYNETTQPHFPARSNDPAKLAWVAYGMSAPFYDGMIDAANPDTSLVEGSEYTYIDKDHTLDREVFETEVLPLIGADHAKYKQKFSLALATWLDPYWRTGGWSFTDFSINYWQPAALEKSLVGGLQKSDEYVWLYDEHLVWWGPSKNVPSPYWVAVSRAQNSTRMEFAAVGNPGNEEDMRPSNGRYPGAVGYEYLIGKYEVTNDQYCRFLNAVAKSDPHGLYNLNMGNSGPDYRGGIARGGSPGRYFYAPIPGREFHPVNWVSCRSAMRYCNWMHNGMTDDPASTESGAYDASTFTTNQDGTVNDQRTHNLTARYWIPTDDEWYKAACYKGGSGTAGFWTYPTKSDTAPAGGVTDTPNTATFNPSANLNDVAKIGTHSYTPGYYLTYDMGGNLWEMVEEWSSTAPNSLRAVRGGAYDASSASSLAYDSWTGKNPADGYKNVGFRVASKYAYAVQGTITFGDFTGDKSSIPVTIEIREYGSTIRLETHVVHTASASSGSYSFSTYLTPGMYDVVAKGSHWLARKTVAAWVSESSVLNFSLVNGDSDGDNVVTSTDLSVVMKAMGSAAGPPIVGDWNVLSDLNGDGQVTSADLGILLWNMDRTGES